MEERDRGIVLIGFMGTGKSSVGRVLEQHTGWPRYDTDELIAERAGMTITDIFDRHGEAAFRELETEALRELPTGAPAIIVTGGGVVLREENVSLLRALGTLVNLTADLETLFERVARRNTRPLLRSDDPRRTLAELLNEREPFYRGAADLEIDTSALTHDEVARAVLSRL
jgi:shikimate kinase